jgi:hypothetical protein
VIYTSNGTILSILSKYIPRISQKTRVVKVFVLLASHSTALGQMIPPSFVTEHYPSSSQSMQFTVFASPLPQNVHIVSRSLQPQMLLYYGHHDPLGSQKENNIYPQQRG